MRAMPQLRRHVACVVAMVMFVLTGPIDAAHAALITTEQAVEAGAAQGERERVAAFLARDDVRTQMVALGVDPSEAADRVASLSDAEVRQIEAATRCAEGWLPCSLRMSMTSRTMIRLFLKPEFV